MATPAQRTNTWTLDEWYAQSVAGTTGGYVGENQLWTWGNNQYGGFGQNNKTTYISPRQIPGTTWAKATGSTTSAAIKTDGTLWTWGRNSSGILGQNLGAANAARSSPVQVPGTTWSNISSGVYFMLATKTDGSLWSWGKNSDGVLGQNQAPANLDGNSSPTQVGTDTTWSNITSAAYASAAVKTDGTLWTWGRNNYGALGHNQGSTHSIATYSSPKQVGTNTNWSSVAMSEDGAAYQTFALKTDGTLWAMGYGDLGALGQNNYQNRSSPVQIPGTDWSSIKAESRGGLMALKQF